MDEIRNLVSEMICFIAHDISESEETFEAEEFLNNLITVEGKETALLVLWYVYAENLCNNRVKAALLHILGGLDDKGFHRFAMAIVGEQFIRKDVEMINHALDYIERRPSKRAMSTLLDVGVDDIETMERVERVRYMLRGLNDLDGGDAGK